jgi:hypothetical protein
LQHPEFRTAHGLQWCRSAAIKRQTPDIEVESALPHRMIVRGCADRDNPERSAQA